MQLPERFDVIAESVTLSSVISPCCVVKVESSIVGATVALSLMNNYDILKLNLLVKQ